MDIGRGHIGMARAVRMVGMIIHKIWISRRAGSDY